MCSMEHRIDSITLELTGIAKYIHFFILEIRLNLLRTFRHQLVDFCRIKSVVNSIFFSSSWLKQIPFSIFASKTDSGQCSCFIVKICAPKRNDCRFNARYSIAFYCMLLQVICLVRIKTNCTNAFMAMQMDRKHFSEWGNGRLSHKIFM